MMPILSSQSIFKLSIQMYMGNDWSQIEQLVNPQKICHKWTSDTNEMHDKSLVPDRALYIPEFLTEKFKWPQLSVTQCKGTTILQLQKLREEEIWQASFTPFCQWCIWLRANFTIKHLSERIAIKWGKSHYRVVGNKNAVIKVTNLCLRGSREQNGGAINEVYDAAGEPLLFTDWLIIFMY